MLFTIYYTMKYVVIILCLLCSCKHTAPPAPESSSEFSLTFTTEGMYKFNALTGDTWIFVEGRWMLVPSMSVEESNEKIDEINRRALLQLRRLPGL